MKFLNIIYWLLYRIFPSGRRAYKLKKGLEGMQKSRAKRRAARMKVVHSAGEQLKPKKILGFFKGGSVAKSKKSDHQVIEQAKRENKELLNNHGLKITKEGRIKNA